MVAAKLRRPFVHRWRNNRGFGVQRVVLRRADEANVLTVRDDNQKIAIRGHLKAFFLTWSIMGHFGRIVFDPEQCAPLVQRYGGQSATVYDWLNTRMSANSA